MHLVGIENIAGKDLHLFNDVDLLRVCYLRVYCMFVRNLIHYRVPW